MTFSLLVSLRFTLSWSTVLLLGPWISHQVKWALTQCHRDPGLLLPSWPLCLSEQVWWDSEALFWTLSQKELPIGLRDLWVQVFRTLWWLLLEYMQSRSRIRGPLCSSREFEATAWEWSPGCLGEGAWRRTWPADSGLCTYSHKRGRKVTGGSCASQGTERDPAAPAQLQDRPALQPWALCRQLRGFQWDSSRF